MSDMGLREALDSIGNPEAQRVVREALEQRILEESQVLKGQPAPDPLLEEAVALLRLYFDNSYDGACWENDVLALLKKLEPVCKMCGNKGRVIMYAPDGDCGSNPCPDCQPALDQRQVGNDNQGSGEPGRLSPTS